MTRVGFIIKPQMTEAANLLDELVPWLVKQGHEPVVPNEAQLAPDGVTLVPDDALGKQIDVAVVLGGDGTMLRAAALVADDGIPVLGINLGRLGFLTGFDPSEAESALQRAIAGELSISERIRLSVTFHRRGAQPVTRTALNDAVIHQGAMARIIELRSYLDGELIAAYRADGIIVSTPTGSTAYNMAAGGPILIPGLASMALTPICAHSLTNRPLVVSPQSVISIELRGESRGVVLTVDGQWAHSFLPGDRVDVTTANKPLRVFNSDKRYFDIMREKLHWGARSDKDAT